MAGEVKPNATFGTRRLPTADCEPLATGNCELLGRKLSVMSATDRQPARMSWASGLWLMAALLFALTAWQQPANRVLDLSLATVFGILGVAMATRRR